METTLRQRLSGAIPFTKNSMFTKHQWVCIIVIGISDFFNALCFSILAPFFPQVAELKGCSATEYGLIFGIFELVVFVVSPIYGIYINKIGCKTLFKVGISVTAVMAILFGFLDQVNGHGLFLSLSLIIRIIEAIGNAAFLTASFAIIAQEFPDNLSVMFASLETMFGLGLIVGPTLGGALYTVGGYSVPFIVLGACLFCAAIVSCILLPEDEADRAAKNAVSNPNATMMALIKIAGVQLAALSIVSTSISIGFLQATLEPHLRQFDFSAVTLGLMFVVNGAVYAISAPIWGYICDRPNIKPKYITIIGCIFIALAFLLIGPCHLFQMKTEIWLTIIGLILHGLGIGSQLVASFADALNTAVANGLPNSIETYGLVSGMWTSAFALGAFIGPTMSGILFDYMGFRQSTIFITILHIILLFIVLIFIWIDRTSGMDVSVSAGDLLQLDGTPDSSVLLGEEYQNLAPRSKSRRRGITVEQSRPPAMNSLIACSSYKNRRSPWSQRTPSYRPAYGSLDSRFRGALTNT